MDWLPVIASKHAEKARMSSCCRYFIPTTSRCCDVLATREGGGEGCVMRENMKGCVRGGERK